MLSGHLHALRDVEYDTPMHWYLPPTKHPFLDSRQGMFIFSRKVEIWPLHIKDVGVK